MIFQLRLSAVLSTFAGAALLAAAQSGDRSAWLEIFGPDGAELLFTGNAAQDGGNLRDFVAAYTRMNRWGQIKAGGQTLYIGPDNYAFPIPLDKDSAGRWSFDTAAGKDEILARGIGRNELGAIVTGPEPMAKRITSAPGVALALCIACRSEPAPRSFVLVTVNVADSSVRRSRDSSSDTGLDHCFGRRLGISIKFLFLPAQ